MDKNERYEHNKRNCAEDVKEYRRKKQESIDFMMKFMKEKYPDFEDMKFLKSIRKEVFDEIDEIINPHAGMLSPSIDEYKREFLILSKKKYLELKERLT